MTIDRRTFLASSAVLSSGALASGALAPGALASSARLAPHISGSDPIRVGVIGCGGRGTGAAQDSLAASERVHITALADVFSHRLESCRAELEKVGDRSKVSPERCFVGFDAYQKLLDAGELDLVILATPPGFRPIHFAAAVKKGVHIFFEKPVATDPTGIRMVLAAAEEAEKKKLCVVAGTQRRHETCYREAMKRLRDGAIGQPIAARASWNQGGLWVVPRKPEWSDMEWQLRNWLYFTWLSGDHICEQHVHNLDVVNWAKGAHPKQCVGMGGRQVRVEPNYGNVFDHFAVEFEYDDGFLMSSQCRQTDGCDSRVEERIIGSEGSLLTRPGYARITGKHPWVFDGENGNPYIQEHVDLIAAITSGPPIQEARAVAESTLTAIMGRLSAYTGKLVTWDQALASKLQITPAVFEMGPLPVAPVPVPGRTPLG